MTRKNKIAVVVAIIVITGITIYLMNFSTTTDRLIDDATTNFIPELEIKEVFSASFDFEIETSGIVQAKRMLKVVPEVSGRIEWVSPKWKNGGYFKAGEVLFKLEKNDFENALAKAKAQLAEANARFIQEQGMVNVAKQEWQKRKNKSQDPAARSLALREPQYASAKASYEAAESDLSLAKLSLARTSVRAPFSGIILNKAADLGQIVTSSQVIAELVAIDVAEIRVPLNQSQRDLITLPQFESKSRLPVSISLKSSANETSYEGTLVRTEGVLDEQTKVLYAVVEVEDPYQLNSDNNDKPLMLGSYVSIIVPGKKLKNVFLLPEYALRQGGFIYFVENDVLNKKSVEVIPNYKNLPIIRLDSDRPSISVVVGRIGDAIVGQPVKVKPQLLEETL